MPAPAAQFSPALPWAAGTRGTIVLKDPVSKEDLINGALTFINGNGLLFQPEGSDGYVDYHDENDSQVISIAIDDDDETKNVLVVGVAQDADVQRVVVGPAVGRVESIRVLNDQLQAVAVGETGFIVAVTEKDDVNSYATLTQDNAKCLIAQRIENIGQRSRYIIRDSSKPTALNSLFKAMAAVPTGEIANLPMLKVELFSINNDAIFKVLHAPSEDENEGSVVLATFDENLDPLNWGDIVTTVYATI